jgi:indole-3-glycerol phosphate synthase
MTHSPKPSAEIHDRLQEIVRHKRIELETAQRFMPERGLRAACAHEPPTRDFARALREPGLQVIAELKRASPSAGRIREDFDVVTLARQYEAGGAAALSVLTDVEFFEGSLSNLGAAKQAVKLPLLRKDFTLAPYHLFEARCAGADAALLIVAILEAPLLRDLIALADELLLDALVEVHDPAEADVALEAGARILGVNNRDLRTFKTDLAQTERVLRHLPTREGLTLVSESGIRTAEDLRRLDDLGVDAVLIGEHLMRQSDPGEALRAMLEPLRA